MISAKIVADSINDLGNRVTTFVLTYHRYIHAQLLMHRDLSRSVASSRARPILKMIEDITQDTAIPISWGKNKRGMQAEEQLTSEETAKAIAIWKSSCESAVAHAKKLLDLNVHKQIVNRVLEPYMYVTTIVTATEFGNFFNLRVHEAAQPEFQALAVKMLEAYVKSKPVLKKVGEWHLPFTDQYVNEDLGITNLLKISTARIARVSYLNFEGNIDHEKDYGLHDRLLIDKHLGPFEGPCQALDKPIRCGNLIGWKQYRKFFIDENRSSFQPDKLLEGVEQWLREK